MKKFYLSVLTVVIIMGFYAAALAADDFSAVKPDPAPNRIATVDMAAVFALHPMMRYHDENTGLFIKPFNKGTNGAQLLNAIQERKDAYLKLKSSSAAEISRIIGEMASVEGDIKKTNSRKVFEIASLSDKYEALLKEASDENVKKEIIKKRTSELAALESEFNKNLNALRVKYADSKTALDKVYRSLTAAYYMSPAETEDMFKNIGREIKEAINFVAAKKGVLSVINMSRMLNDSYLLNAPGAAGKDSSFASKRFDLRAFALALEAGPDYTKILNFLQPPEAPKPEMSEAEKKYSQTKNEMRLTSEINEYKSAYENRFKIIPLKELAHIMNANIVYGGCDITAPVIVYVFYKNGISKQHAEAVCGALNEVEDLDE